MTNLDSAAFVSVPMGILDGKKDDLKPVTEFHVKRRVDWFPGVAGSEET